MKRERKKIWIIGDVIVYGIGRKLHFLTSGVYRIMERSEGGESIGRIEEIVVDTLIEKTIKEGDLVIIKGRRNGLKWIGEEDNK